MQMITRSICLYGTTCFVVSIGRICRGHFFHLLSNVMQNPILHHMRRRSIGVIGGNLDEHLSKATRLLSGKHLQERLGCVLETIVLALLEL